MKKLSARSSLNKLCGTTISAAIAFFTVNGYAVEQPSSDNKMETVTVSASRNQQSLADIDATLSIVSGEDLQQILPTHINEALARVPGVWASRGNGQESLPAIRSPSLTGSGSCGSFYVAEDGVPVRATGFCNVNQLFDTNSEQAQRIEVLKGPGNAIHGSGAMHGVINVLSQDPSESRATQWSIEGGPHDYQRYQISHSDTVDQNAYRINFNGTSDGGYKDDSGFDQQKLSIRHDYNGGDITVKSLLTMTNLNQETAGYVGGSDAYKDESRKKENPNPEAFRDSQSLRFQSRIERQLDNGGVFVVTPFVRSSEMEFLMHFLPGTPLEENGQDSIGIQTSYSRPISEQFTLTNGFDAEYTDAYLKQSQDGGFSSFPNGKQYDYEVTAKVFAAFLDGRYVATERTQYTAGARFERIAYDYDNRMISGDTAEDGSICVNGFTGAVGCRYSRPDDREDKFNNWSLNAGFIHQLRDDLSLVGRLTRGFRAPQSTELYRLQAGQLTADLDSEKIESIEFSIRGDVADISYQLSSFYMEKSNVIFQDSDRLNTDQGETEHYGLEFSLHRRLSESFDLSINGTFARHKYTSDVTTPAPGSATVFTTKGNDIDTAPRRMSSVQLGWEINSATRAELEWVSMGKYYTDIDNLYSYEGHDLFNARIRHQYNENISVGLRVTNLSDEDYAERADFSTFNGERYFIGEPRSVYADIRVNY